MQFAMQASVQGMRVAPPTFHLRHHQVTTLRAGCMIKRFPIPASQFLAPGLESLRLQSVHPARQLKLESGARAEGGGAYDKDAFVDGNEASKISLVRGLLLLFVCASITFFECCFYKISLDFFLAKCALCVFFKVYGMCRFCTVWAFLCT